MPSKYIHITFLLVIVTTTICYQTSQTLPQSIPSYKDRPIGCFYSDSICSSVEICFDDHAFGRCERIDVNGQVENDFTYQLDAKTFQLLRKELLRLSSQGYDWPDDYSQCILKTILNDRPRIVYDPSVCDHFMANDHSSNEVSAIRSLFTESLRSSDDHKSAPNRHLSWIFSSEKPVPRQQTKIENDPFNDDSQLVSYLRQIIDEHDDNNNRADTLSRLFVSDDDLPQAASLVRVPEIRVSRDITSNNDDDGDDSNFELKVLPLNEDLMIVDLDNEHQKQDSGEDVDEESSAQALDDLTDFNSFDKFNFDRHQRDDIKKPGPIYVEEYWFRTDEQEHPGDNNQMHDMSRAATKIQSSPTKKGFSSRASQPIAEGPVKMEKQSKSQENMLIIRSLEQGEHSNLEAIDSTHTYVVTDKILGEEDSGRFLQTIEQLFNLPRGTFSNLRKENHRITFKVNPNYLELNASQVAARIENMTQLIQNATGYSISETGIGDRINLPIHSPIAIAENNRHIKFLVILTCSLVVSVLMVAYLFYLLRDSLFRERIKRLMKLSEEWIHFDYQDLCRQRFGKNKADVEQGKQNKEDTKTADNQPTANETTAPHSPGSRSSTSSWVEEPVSSNMDITTGHIILTYMEEHLKNKLLLDEEWQALCAYEADPCSTNAALQKKNLHKNRYPDILPYDHSRVILNDSANVSNSDYINANTISDHDPRNPAYIATQGPLPNTNADFWQMIWEQGSVLIVMLTRLRENGLNMCDRYWPEEGSQLYGNDYEVHLVSEHIWCDDYLVRSFYLKNLKTGQTRTVTQFHYLSWPENGVPATIKSLLDFRRKVNKSYKGRSCPIVVHCSDGVARTGTYILIDMVLNRMAKGAKEIDIAASLEHLRDQRMGMVRTKAQFEFVLLAVADEVQAILKALSNNQ